MNRNNLDNLLFQTLVSKALKEDGVITDVLLLGTGERIVTIAKMMSGEKPTAAALESAREMVIEQRPSGKAVFDGSIMTLSVLAQATRGCSG